MNRLQASMTVSPPEWIIMFHPELEDSYTQVSVASYEENYRDAGWEQADFSEEESTTAVDATVGKAEQEKATTPAEKKE